MRLVSSSCVLGLVPAVAPKWLLPDEPFRVLAEVLQTAPGAKIILEARTPSGQTVQYPLSIPEIGSHHEVQNLPSREPIERQQDTGKGQSQPDGKADMEEDDWQMVSEGQEAVPGEALLVLHAMGQVKALLNGRSSMHVMPDGQPVHQPPSQVSLHLEPSMAQCNCDTLQS